jgi:hypothetical protein
MAVTYEEMLAAAAANNGATAPPASAQKESNVNKYINLDFGGFERSFAIYNDVPKYRLSAADKIIYQMLIDATPEDAEAFLRETPVTLLSVNSAQGKTDTTKVSTAQARMEAAKAKVLKAKVDAEKAIKAAEKKAAKANK